MTTKRCARCKMTLPVELFGTNPARRDGRNQYCYPCNRDYHRKRRAKRKGEEA